MFHQTHPANKNGRDFVVGDLHGSAKQLDDALQAVQFDTQHDRLFVVGDVINRGPDSFNCLCLLEKPWFYMVPGNHEAMLLTWAGLRSSNHHSADDFIKNGGGAWLARLNVTEADHLVNVLLPLVEKLPFVRHVQDEVRPFNVLHAEALNPYTGTLLTDSELKAQDLRRYEVPLTWSRDLSKEARRAAPDARLVVQGVTVTNAPLEQGLSLTYVGHSIMSRPLLHRSHVFIDCGAFREPAGRGYLHLMEHMPFAKALNRALSPYGAP